VGRDPNRSELFDECCEGGLPCSLVDQFPKAAVAHIYD
jgi:hypothetical protein